MKFLPIAERELRVASRRPETYWTRFGAASAAISVCVTVLLATLDEPPADQSKAIFIGLSIASFVYALLCGVRTTADCLSEEKRDGTLGLLFLTDLRGYDVIAGKLLANSLHTICALLALLPVIALPLLLGGVAGTAVWQMALVLVNTMFLSLALGVVISSLVRDPRHAIGGTVALVIVLIALVPLARWLLLEYVVRPNPAVAKALHVSTTPDTADLRWMHLANPLHLLELTFEAAFRAVRPGNDYWRALGVQHGLAWAAVALACLLLPRVWQDRAMRHTRVPHPEGTRHAVNQRAARAELLEPCPFTWVVARERRTGFYNWVGLVIIVAVWLWGLIEMKEDWLQGMIGLWTLFWAGAWLKLRLAASATRPLHEHRRSGTLELILCTPQTPGDILRGHLLGLGQQFMAPVATVLAAGALLMIAAISQGVGGRDAVEIIAAFFVGLMALVLDSFAVAWAGMSCGLRSRRYARAFSQTVFLTLWLPWLVFIVSTVLIAVSLDALNLSHVLDPSFGTLIAWWALIHFGFDALFILSSRAALRRHFRELALEHYGPIRPATGGAAPRPEPAPMPPNNVRCAASTAPEDRR